MKKNLQTAVLAFITTAIMFVSFTNAQTNIIETGEDLGFFGEVSVRVYCTFANFVPGSDNKACATNILINDRSENTNSTQTSNTGATTLTAPKIAQINNVISQGINTGLTNRSNVVYVQGPAGRDGRNGTTTIVYQSVPGAPQSSPAAYIYAGGNGTGINSNYNPYQTTVPGDIHSTFIHHLRWEDANGDLANITNLNASNTNTVTLVFQNATGTNLTATGTITTLNLFGTNATLTNSTSTNLFATNASLTNATSTNLFSFFANLINLVSEFATITNATTTNLFATNASITNATATNIFANNASVTNATTSNLFSNYASITEATTTYLFSTNASLTNATITNLFVQFLTVFDLFFTNATGTNLSATNITSTGTFALATGTIASTTANWLTANNAEIKAGNATVSTIVAGNATSTNLFSTNASLTNASSTNLFAAFLNAISATIQNLMAANATLTNATTTNLVSTNASTSNLLATSATVTNSTSTKIFATNASITNATSTNLFSALANFFRLTATNATLTNATITNLRVENCAEGNVLCNGGNDTGAIVGTDAPVVIGSLNAANINFITGDLGAPSVTPGAVKLVIETGLPAEGSGAVRVTNNLKVGADLVASGTATVTNLVATGTFRLATGTIASTTVSWLTALRAIFTNATITNATTTNLFAVNSTLAGAEIQSGNATLSKATVTDLFVTNASITSATTTNLFSTFANFLNLFVSNLGFDSATGTNLQVANASTSNLSATGTSVITNLYGTLATFTEATTTSLFANSSVLNNAEIKAGNATVTTLVSGNSTSTNLFVNLFKTINANIDNLSALALDFTNATGTTLQLADLSTTNIVATGTATVTNIFANNIVTNNFTATGTINLGTTTMTGSLIPFASTTWMTLGNLANPWSELYVSSSSVYIGGTKISNLDGVLSWGGNNIVTTNGTSSDVSAETLSASTSIASTSIVGMLYASSTILDTAYIGTLTGANASVTQANFGSTTVGVANFGSSYGNLIYTGELNAGTSSIFSLNSTNLFAHLGTFVTGMFTDLFATNATIISATSTNLFASWFRATNASIDTLTTNNLLSGNISATGTISTENLFATSSNLLGLSANNATLTTATITNLEVANFLPNTAAKIAAIATSSTENSLTFSTTTNILQSIVNGKISTTSLASLVGSSGGNHYALRQTNLVQTNSVGELTTNTDLEFNIAPGEKWVVQASISFNTNSTGAMADFGIGIVNTASSTGGTCQFGVSVAPDTGFEGCDTVANTSLRGTGNYITMTGLVTGGTSAGVVKIGYSNVGGSGIRTAQLLGGSTFVAYKLTGADLAEVYFAKDTTIQEGDVVALDGTGISQVSKSSKKYQKNVLGIISTKPGIVMGEVDGEGKAVIVGLSGRVPVKVTDKNGKIKAGDFLTASDIPGVAMKATGAGQVIGQALTDDMGTGKVMVFIKNTYHDGNSDTDTEDSIADKFTQIVKNTLEKLSDVYLNMTLAISSLKANDVSANKVIVQEFCVGSECFTESDMKEFRNYLDSKKAPVETVTTPTVPVVTETPVTETTSTETTVTETNTNTQTEEQTTVAAPTETVTETSTTENNSVTSEVVPTTETITQ